MAACHGVSGRTGPSVTSMSVGKTTAKAVILLGWYFMLTEIGGTAAPPRQYGPFESKVDCESMQVGVKFSEWARLIRRDGEKIEALRQRAEATNRYDAFLKAVQESQERSKDGGLHVSDCWKG
jgi:hypothetical protein